MTTQDYILTADDYADLFIDCLFDEKNGRVEEQKEIKREEKKLEDMLPLSLSSDVDYYSAKVGMKTLRDCEPACRYLPTNPRQSLRFFDPSNYKRLEVVLLRNSTGANRVYFTYMGNDTYNVVLVKVRIKRKPSISWDEKIIKEIRGVCKSDLVKVCKGLLD